MDLLSEFYISEGEIQTTMRLEWPPTLCRDIAIEGDVVPIQDILDRYSLTLLEYEQLCKLSAFKQELNEWQRKVLEEGMSFKLKMQALCSEFVPELHHLGTNRELAPSVRLDAIKTAARLAHYEPKDNATGPTSNVPQVNIQINM